jgi:mRNA interferase MazF
MQRRVFPAHGEIWVTAFDPAPPAVGHEQAGTRPALVISTDSYNSGPARLVVVIPMTTRPSLRPLHTPVDPPEGGLRRPSTLLCDQLRNVAHARLLERWGRLSPATLTGVERWVRALLGL